MERFIQLFLIGLFRGLMNLALSLVTGTGLRLLWPVVAPLFHLEPISWFQAVVLTFLVQMLFKAETKND